MSGVLSEGVDEEEGIDAAPGDVASSHSSIASSTVSWASTNSSGSKRAAQAFQMSWAPIAAMGKADFSREPGEQGAGAGAA